MLHYSDILLSESSLICIRIGSVPPANAIWTYDTWEDNFELRKILQNI